MFVRCFLNVFLIDEYPKAHPFFLLVEGASAIPVRENPLSKTAKIVPHEKKTRVEICESDFKTA